MEYYLTSWLIITIISLLLLSLNAYYPMRMMDIHSVDYFLKEVHNERFLEPYLLVRQIIMHGYVMSVVGVFLKEMKIIYWLVALQSKIKIISIILIITLVSGGLMQHYVSVLDHHLSPIMEVPALASYHLLLSSYLGMLYFLAWALFRWQGCLILWGLSVVSLLYPASEIKTLKTLYQWFGLTHRTMEIRLSGIQVLGIFILMMVASFYRMYQRSL
jgi:hypothetical protein